MSRATVTPERSAEFIALWKKLYGEELSARDAAERLTKLIGVYAELISGKVNRPDPE